MTFDASTVDRALRKKDTAIKMGKTLARMRAMRHMRLSQNDLCQRTLLGENRYPKVSELTCTVEDLKESRDHPRRDCGMTFDQHKSRFPTRLKAEFSSLKRPRDMAAPDFSR